MCLVHGNRMEIRNKRHYNPCTNTFELSGSLCFSVLGNCLDLNQRKESDAVLAVAPTAAALVHCRRRIQLIDATLVFEV